MNRTRLLLSITLFSLLPTALPAQIVPLILEETITLPVANTVWDVIPHSDGFYYYVQAEEVDEGTTTVFYGTAHIPAWTTWEFTGHRPTTIRAFFQSSGITPSVLIENFWSGDMGEVESDCTLVRVIDLESNQILESRAYVEGNSGSMFDQTHCENNHLSDVLLVPPPPAITTQLSLAVGYHYYNEFEWLNQSSSTSGDTYFIIPNFISNPDLRVPSTEEYFDMPYVFGSRIALFDRSIELMSVSAGNSSSSGRYGSNTYQNVYCHIEMSSITDTDRTRLLSFGSNYDPTEIGAEHCSVGAVSCTFDPVLNCPLFAAYWNGDLVGRSANSDDTVNWSVPESHDQLFAVDAAENDGREEILGYRANLESIHIYRAHDGWPYGRTSEITPNPDRIAIIGRFSDEFRRLALQYGNQVFMYSFGEYLATDPDRPDPINRSQVLLSSSPQPAHDFVQFKLSTPLATNSNLKLFNILGREVLSKRLSPQTPSLSVNISALPSGVYFAAIDNQPQISPHKFIILK